MFDKLRDSGAKNAQAFLDFLEGHLSWIAFITISWIALWVLASVNGYDLGLFVLVAIWVTVVLLPILVRPSAVGGVIITAFVNKDPVSHKVVLGILWTLAMGALLFYVGWKVPFHENPGLSLALIPAVLGLGIAALIGVLRGQTTSIITAGRVQLIFGTIIVVGIASLFVTHYDAGGKAQNPAERAQGSGATAQSTGALIKEERVTAPVQGWSRWVSIPVRTWFSVDAEDIVDIQFKSDGRIVRSYAPKYNRRNDVGATIRDREFRFRSASGAPENVLVIFQPK